MKAKSFFALMLGMLQVIGVCNGQEKQVSVKDGNDHVVDGHEYVDLGLPSGTLWATCNVGANSPEEYGDYFAWGETAQKSKYNRRSYKFGNETRQLTKYCNDSDYGENGLTDTKTVLDPEDDAATANWGSGWRMPTVSEFEELYNNCASVWMTQNGKNGRLFTGPNGNVLFLPAAGMKDELNISMSYGYYWSSSLCTSRPLNAYYLGFDSEDVTWNDGVARFCGRSVRPVVKR